MDPFRTCLALGPVAVYLLVLGAINLARRPLLVTGTRDYAALGLALLGLVIVGPIELFFPITAAIRLEMTVWILLLALYAMLLVLLLLLMRPRLVIYNISTEELRPVLAEVVTELDAEARWAGDSLALPNLGVQLHLDNVPSLRNVSLVSSGPLQNHQGWRRLELALAAALGEIEVSRNYRAISFLTTGGMIAGFLMLLVARNPQAVAQSFFDMLKT